MPQASNLQRYKIVIKMPLSSEFPIKEREKEMGFFFLYQIIWVLVFFLPRALGKESLLDCLVNSICSWWGLQGTNSWKETEEHYRRCHQR